MIGYIANFLLSFIAYLFLTANQGDILGFWSQYEIIFGVIISVIVTIISTNILFKQKEHNWLNPVRWVIFLAYIVGPFFYAMAKANIDVAIRVITGNIKPGIVKISPGLKSDNEITLLANSITLTPGTLTVDIDEKNNDLYIHWINVTNLKPSIEEICGTFPKWARRIAG